MRTTPTLLLITAALATTPAAVFAQADGEFFVGMRESHGTLRVSGQLYKLYVAPNFGTANAQIEYIKDPEGTPASQWFSLAMHRVTGLHRLRNDAVLVAGREYTSWAPLQSRGVLQHVSFAGGTAVTLDTRTYAGTDFTQFFRNPLIPGVHFYLDHQNKNVSLFAFLGEDPSEMLPTDYGVAADEAALSLLRYPQELWLAPDDDGQLFTDVNMLATNSIHFEVRNQGVSGLWNVNFVLNDPPTSYWVEPHQTINAHAPLRVASPPAGPTSYELYDDNDDVLIQSGALQAGAMNYVNLPDALNANLHHSYSLRAPGQEDARFYPTVRYGVAAELPQWGVSSVLLPTNYSRVGDPRYGVSVGVDCNITTGSVQAYYNIAFRDPQGNDPVIINANGTAVLTPLATATHTLDTGHVGSNVGYSLPIIDDASFEGAVVLWQALFVTPDGSLAFSEVVGAGIQSNDIAAVRAPHSLDVDVRKQWLVSHGFVKPEGRVLALVDRMRH